MAAVWDDPAIAAGIATQRRALRERLDAGEEVVGWKIGFNSQPAMERLGIAAPLVGFFTSGNMLASGTSLSLDGWTQAAVEPELAIHLARDLGVGSDRDETAAAIGAIGPAIELADLDTPVEDLEAVVGGDIFQRHVILGDADPARAGGDVDGIRVRVLNHGQEIGATDDPTAFTGELLGLVSHVADWLAAAGDRLRAGQVVIAGSVIPIVWAQPGDRIEYVCEPLGTLEVEFAS